MSDLHDWRPHPRPSHAVNTSAWTCSVCGAGLWLDKGASPHPDRKARVRSGLLGCDEYVAWSVLGS